MEIWKDIQGYDGYQVSNLGRVRSIDRYVLYSNGVTRKHKGRIMKNHKVRKGYESISLYADRKQNEVFVHRLVAQAFLGLDINDSKIFVCHKDDNPSNNNVDNLFIGDNSKNMLDMFSKDRGVDNSGENHGLSKLTEEDVIEIKRLLKTGVRHKDIGDRFGVGTTCISRINTGKRRGHIDAKIYIIGHQ